MSATLSSRRMAPPASAPATRQTFHRAQRITVATRLRNSIIQEAPDSDDEEDSQFATIHDDESIPDITIQSASSYKGSPATASLPSFAWEHQISQSIDQQIRAAPAIASRGELARLAAARRMHNRRSQSMYLSSETPATPPLSPPNDGYSNLTSPAPFTSAISPYPFMAQFAAWGMMMPQVGPMGQLPMMPMTALPAPRAPHRRSTSANYGRQEVGKAQAAALPSLDEIRILFEKRKAAAAAAKGEEIVKKAEQKKEDEKTDGEKVGEEEKETEKPKEETDRERRASGLKLLKRRSLALQTDLAGAPLADASPNTVSPASPAKPQQLTPILTTMPAIKVEEPQEISASPSPKTASLATKRRPVSLQVPSPSAFAGLPSVLRSPELPPPPKNLLAMRQGSADRSVAARKMLHRLSNRVVLAV